jgi:glycogen operon protein
MLLAGDEFLNSQNGNNNVYCQDNPVGWVNWSNLEKNRDMYEFVRKMIAFRHAHPVLRDEHFYTGMNVSGYPELSFHGTRAWDLDTSNPFHTFGFMHAETREDHGVEEDCFIYCGVNTYWEVRTLELPVIPASMQWQQVAYTYPSTPVDGRAIEGSITLAPRSLMVLIGKHLDA